MRTSIPILTCLALLGAPGATAAAPWIDLGPFTGQPVADLVFDPANPHVLYAGTGAGVFVSRDAGRHWEPSNEGLLRASRSGPPIEVTDLAIHPHDPDTLYAASRPGCVHKSVDRGAHWRSLCEPFEPPVDRIDIAPSDPAVLYASTSESFYFYRSGDGGESWTRRNDPARFWRTAGVVLDPRDPKALLLAGATVGPAPGEPKGLLLRSLDGGDTWSEISAAPLAETVPTALSRDPRSPETLYLATEDGGLFVTPDAGQTWSAIHDELPLGGGAHVSEIAADPRSPGRLYVALAPSDPAPPGARPAAALFRSEDGGAHWQAADAGLPAGHRISTVTFHPDAPAVLYAPGSAGVFRSDDAGASWQRAGVPLPTSAGAVEVRQGGSGTIYVTGGTSGAFRSEDGGSAWEALPVPGSGGAGDLIVLDLALDRNRPSALYLAALEFTPAEARFRQRWFASDDEGRTWSEPADGRDGLFLDLLAVVPTDPPALLAGGFSGLYRSADGGATWEAAIEDRFSSLVVSAADPARVYAGVLIPSVVGAGPFPVPGVWRSRDGGAAWTPGRQGLPRTLSVTAVAEHPADAAILFAGTAFHGAGGPFGALYRSDDGGETWRPFGDGLPPLPITALLFHPVDASVVFAGVEAAGVFWSLDAGATWQPLGNGPGHTWVRELAIEPDGSAVYATTPAGVHRRSLEALEAGPLPGGPWIEDAALPGFRMKVRIGHGGGQALAGLKVPVCIPETVCVSGAVPGRSELFVRVVGPKPNGYLWPTLVKFSTSRIEVWLQQLGSGELRYYELPGATPDSGELPGRFDRLGFRP